MSRVKIPEIKTVKTDKIYVQSPNGTLDTRLWCGDYNSYIDTAPCFGTRYEHIRFEKDGVPVVREIPFSELVRKRLI
jgi:hypothetical protein